MANSATTITAQPAGTKARGSIPDTHTVASNWPNANVFAPAAAKRTTPITTAAPVLALNRHGVNKASAPEVPARLGLLAARLGFSAPALRNKEKEEIRIDRAIRTYHDITVCSVWAWIERNGNAEARPRQGWY
jgi:hypothetical protein